MAAPVTGFLALETLVWSQARNAEGEKGALSLLQAYSRASSGAGTLIVPEMRSRRIALLTLVSWGTYSPWFFC